jgi:hypothetical protein
MNAFHGNLIVIEPNHGRLLGINLTGGREPRIEQLSDLSAPLGHIGNLCRGAKECRWGRIFRLPERWTASWFSDRAHRLCPVDPRNHNVLYVAFEGAGVFKSTNGGDSWTAINSGLDDLGVFGIALDSDSPDILYVSTNSSVYNTTSGGE